MGLKGGWDFNGSLVGPSDQLGPELGECGKGLEGLVRGLA